MIENSVEKLRLGMKDSLFCCGLDPDLKKIPTEITGSSAEIRIRRFLEQVIDVTAPHVCAYKVQKAFFDILPDGHNLLKEVVAYSHSLNPNVPVILDCKIGDIDNTMQVYLENLFGEIGADGIVVNPYMGDDVMRPLAEYPDKAIVVLAKTSNPNGGVVQDVKLESGIPLWQHILRLTVERWNTAGNMVPVVSSTVGLNLTDVRKMIPDQMPILLAGVGAQGGSFTEISNLLNSEKSGVFVNSSRGIIYAQPKGRETWQEAVGHSALSLKEALNTERNK